MSDVFKNSPVKDILKEILDDMDNPGAVQPEEPKSPDADPMGPPHYRVEMTEFKCLDESGIDFFGSDEVAFAVTSFTVDSDNDDKLVKRHKDVSREFGDVDTGTTRFMGTAVSVCRLPNHRADPRCKKTPFLFVPKDIRPEDDPIPVIRYRFPEATPAGGLQAPFSVLLVGTEVDQGGIEQVEQDVNDIADLIEEAGIIFGADIEIPSKVRSRISSVLGNDAIGVKMLNFHQSELEQALTNAGLFFHERVRINGEGSGDIPFTGGGDYRVTLMVSREK